MPSLNKAKNETKTILKWGGISLLIIFLFFFGIRFVTLVKDALAPTPPPQVSFGKLLVIPFPDQQKENIIYSLDTLSGFLPNFGDRVKVYQLPQPQPTLLALENAQKKVSNVDFRNDGVKISSEEYQWNDLTSPFQRRIIMNIFSSDFSLSSPYLVIPSLQNFSNSDEEENRAINLATSFLSDMSLLPKDLDKEKTTTILYSIDNSTLNPTSRITNAKIIRVNFFQKDLGNLPIYYEKGPISNINFLIAKEDNRLKVVEAHYSYKNISDISSTYPIKSASQAYAELKQGKGYIASKPKDAVGITINKVSLGYYVGQGYQEYLMPVVIFEGENNFVAYVSAVKDELINN